MKLLFVICEVPLPPVNNVRFDPHFRCTWADDAYRAEMNVWLRDRLGTHEVAYLFDAKAISEALGHPSPSGLVIDPQYAAMIRF